MSQTDPNVFLDYTGALLRSEGSTPRREPQLDRLLRALGEELTGPGPDLDPLTLAGLHDGTLPEDEQARLEAEVRTSPAWLRQAIDLSAVLQAYEEDAAPSAIAPPPVQYPEAIVDALESRSMAPIVELAERRRWRRSSWVAAVASVAALLLLGVFLLVPRPQLPGPLGVEAHHPGSRTLRSGGWELGQTLELSATVEPDVSWAVVAVARSTASQPVRVWVARTSSLASESMSTDTDRVTFQETLVPPSGQRAYLVVAGRTPLLDLPALVTDWEAQLRHEHRQADAFARDLQAIVDAEAGQRRWRVSRVVPVAVAEPQSL